MRKFSLQLEEDILSSFIYAGEFVNDDGTECLRLELGCSISGFQLDNPVRFFSNRTVIRVLEESSKGIYVKETFTGYTKVLDINTKYDTNSVASVRTTILLARESSASK